MERGLSSTTNVQQVDATVAILYQSILNTHQTPANWWREGVKKPIIIWVWLEGHGDGQRRMGEFSQDAEVTPLLLFEGNPGIFYVHR